jgi:hypothetical protein
VTSSLCGGAGCRQFTYASAAYPTATSVRKVLGDSRKARRCLQVAPGPGLSHNGERKVGELGNHEMMDPIILRIERQRHVSCGIERTQLETWSPFRGDQSVGSKSTRLI